MTEAERAFWKLVRNKKLLNLKFRRQQIIDGFIVDFYCNNIGLVVEIDGAVHETEKQSNIDRERNEVFKNLSAQAGIFLVFKIYLCTSTRISYYKV